MEHAVIVYMPLRDRWDSPEERQAIEGLERRLEQAIGAAEAGEFDGDEFGGGVCRLFMYGPDADALFRVIEPVLKSSPIAARGFAIKRYGPASDPGAREVRVGW